jgi:hypothetical protein
MLEPHLQSILLWLFFWRWDFESYLLGLALKLPSSLDYRCEPLVAGSCDHFLNHSSTGGEETN